MQSIELGKGQMRRQYLHLSMYSCDECTGPVVSGSLTVRENEISRETDIREIGAICLSCGHRQSGASGTNATRGFPPIEWQPVTALTPADVTSRVELDRLHEGKQRIVP